LQEEAAVPCLYAAAGLGWCCCRERKNVNLPGVIVDLPTLTDKDVDDILNWGVANEIDVIAASFVRKGSDLDMIREVLGEKGRCELLLLLLLLVVVVLGVVLVVVLGTWSCKHCCCSVAVLGCQVSVASLNVLLIRLPNSSKQA